jgi:hypothetical protein
LQTVIDAVLVPATKPTPGKNAAPAMAAPIMAGVVAGAGLLMILYKDSPIRNDVTVNVTYLKPLMTVYSSGTR